MRPAAAAKALAALAEEPRRKSGVAPTAIPDVASPAFLAVGLLDGRTEVGQSARFSPRDANLLLEPRGRAQRILIPAETIAFIGFHRGYGPPPLGRGAGPRVLRTVHLVSGRAFLVHVDDAAVTSRLGFYATPAEDTSPFESLFFYSQAVLDLERAGTDEPVASQPLPLDELLRAQERAAPPAAPGDASRETRRRARLGDVLVEERLVTQDEIEAAVAEQKRSPGKRIGETLVAMGLVTEHRLAATLARRFNLPFVDLDRCAVNPEAQREVPRGLIAKYGVLPIESDARVLTIAVGDPLDVDGTDQVRFQSSKEIREVLAAPSQLQRHVARCLEAPDADARGEHAGVDQILDELAIDEQFLKEEGADGRTTEAVEGDSAVIKLANQIILDAYRAGASDVHIEPNGAERSTFVRFRIDGDCVSYKEIPPAYRRSLVARLKVMARLDLSERRKPQDGKIRLRLQQKTLELRVATLPTVNGNEDVVMRILAGARPAPLDKMAMSPRNLAELRRLIARPYGLVLCVGPTGSGKTTTLHSALGAINKIDMKIWTAEDPVEITQPGLRQVQVNPKIGLTFAATLRSFLRADPDVIMVGEMRDEETARTAIEASLTGHLVLSTLHTNSAPETVTRLLDMGLDPFTLSDALLGVLAQRLVRTLCKSCRERYDASRAEWDEIAAVYGEEKLAQRLGAPFGPAFTLWRPRGCGACGNTGYQGRLPLHELLVCDDEVRQLVVRRAHVEEIRQAARKAGMATLVEDGIEKALAGLVDVRQVFAVASR